MHTSLLWFSPFSHKLFDKKFPDSSVGKESACNTGDPSSIPGSGRFAGEGIGYPLQYSGLKNPMDCMVRGVTESDTTEWLSLHFHISWGDSPRAGGYNLKVTHSHTWLSWDWLLVLLQTDLSIGWFGFPYRRVAREKQWAPWRFKQKQSCFLNIYCLL